MGRAIRDYTLPNFIRERQPTSIEIAMDGDGQHFLTSSQTDAAFIFSVCNLLKIQLIYLQKQQSAPVMSITGNVAPVISIDWCEHRGAAAIAGGNAVRVVKLEKVRRRRRRI